MAFIVQEIQTTGGVPSFLPQEPYQTREAAESAFYLKCGSACISQVPVHTVLTYTEEGFVIPELTKCFKHEPVPTPNVEET